MSLKVFRLFSATSLLPSDNQNNASTHERTVSNCSMRFAHPRQTPWPQTRPESLQTIPLSLVFMSLSVRVEMMARTKRHSAVRKAPRVARIAARAAGLRTPTKPAKHTSRKEGADLLTPARWKVVTAYYQLLGGRSRLPPGGIATLQKKVFLDSRSTRV